MTAGLAAVIFTRGSDDASSWWLVVGVVLFLCGPLVIGGAMRVRDAPTATRAELRHEWPLWVAAVVLAAAALAAGSSDAPPGAVALAAVPAALALLLLATFRGTARRRA